MENLGNEFLSKEKAMYKKVFQALNSSINNKWKGIRYRAGIDKGPLDCDLCTLFYASNCEGCPVKGKTGKRACENTPYTLWVEHHKTHAPCSLQVLFPGCKECGSICDKQIAFLESLLPNNKKA